MGLKTFEEMLKILERKGLMLSKRTFEYYQRMGFLPKPEKKVGARGRGVYGFYDPDIVLKAVKFILNLKESGVSLEKIKEESERLVIGQYMDHLKKWGFSDIALPEISGLTRLQSDTRIRMLTGEFFLAVPNWFGSDSVERAYKRDRQLANIKRNAFESELIGRAKWWEAEKIEKLTLENISKEATDILRGMLMTADHIFLNSKENEKDKIDPVSVEKLAARVVRKQKDIITLVFNLNRRLAELNGGQWKNAPVKYWKSMAAILEKE